MNIVESIFNSNSLFLDATFHIMYTCTTAHFGPIKVGLCIIQQCLSYLASIR